MTAFQSAARRGWAFVQRHFQILTLMGFVATLMCGWGELYRTFLYLNFIYVLYALYQTWGTSADKNTLIRVLFFPLCLTILHMLAVAEIELVKEIRHLWLAAFLALGVWLLPETEVDWFKRHSTTIVTGLLLFFIAVQLIGFSLLLTDEFSGAMTNPHYLAYYSAIALIANGALLSLSSGRQHRLLMVTAFVLLTFIVITSSRPTWIALAVCLCLWPLYRPVPKKAWLLLLIPVVLYAGNLSNFADRMNDLVVNIMVEERIAIWGVSARMQAASTTWQWLVGHGADRYVTDFPLFIPPEYTDRNYNFPHNTLMEILYIGGIAGLVLLLSLYYSLYARLHSLVQGNQVLAVIAILGLAYHWVMVFLTVPVLSTYNLYPLGLLAGGCLLSKKLRANMI